MAIVRSFVSAFDPLASLSLTQLPVGRSVGGSSTSTILPFSQAVVVVIVGLWVVWRRLWSRVLLDYQGLQCMQAPTNSTWLRYRRCCGRGHRGKFRVLVSWSPLFCWIIPNTPSMATPRPEMTQVATP